MFKKLLIAENMEEYVNPQMANAMIQSASWFKMMWPVWVGLAYVDARNGFPATRVAIGTAAKAGLGAVKLAGAGTAALVSHTYDYLKHALSDTHATKQKKARAAALMKLIKTKFSGKIRSQMRQNKLKKRAALSTTENFNQISQTIELHEKILSKDQINFLICMCNKNPKRKQDILFVELCVKNPKKMNRLTEGTGMDNTRIRMLLFLAEVYGIRRINSEYGKVLSFNTFKKTYKNLIESYSNKVSARNLYSMYLLDSAANIYGLSKLVL